MYLQEDLYKYYIFAVVVDYIVVDRSINKRSHMVEKISSGRYLAEVIYEALLLAGLDEDVAKELCNMEDEERHQELVKEIRENS